VVRVIFLLLFLHLHLLAVLVKIEPEKTSYLCGDKGSFKIVVQGAKLKSVIFPTLRWLDGQFIEDRDYIDQNESSAFKRFDFEATNSFTIPKLKVVVDNQTYYTKPVHIKVEIPKILDGKISCRSYYTIYEYLQNLPFRFTQTCVAWDEDIEIDYIQKPVLWDSDVVKEDDFTQNIELDHNISFKRYILSPYRGGEVSIPNSLVKVTYKDDTYYYPILNYFPKQIKPLPKGIYLVGNYEITSEKISEDRIEVKVTGVGSCDNINEFELILPNATVVKEKHETLNIVDTKRNLCKIIFNEIFFIKTDHNITIDPFELSYFDPATNSIKTIKTKKLFFAKNMTTPSKTKETLPVQKDVDIGKVIIISYVALFLILFILSQYLKIKIQSLEPIQELEEADSVEKLYELLIKYAKDEQLQRYITDLERVIYEKQEIEIDKKEIAKRLSYEIVGKQKVLMLRVLNYLLIALVLGFIPLIGVFG
jgi:hypothetical protein